MLCTPTNKRNTTVLRNQFLFFAFTDSPEHGRTHSYDPEVVNPLLPALHYNGDLLELFETEFINLCGTLDNKTSLAKNTHLCTKTITFQDEIVPTKDGFVTFNYSNSVFTKITKFEPPLQQQIYGYDFVTSHRFHPEELNERLKSEKIMYSLVPPVKNILNTNCAKNIEPNEHHNIQTKCRGIKFEYTG